jgi:hypothetical protein
MAKWWQRAKTRVTALAVVALAGAGLGCEQNPSAPSQVGAGALTIENFAGTIPVGGSAFYSFTAPVPGTITLTLLALKEAGADSAALVNVGLGVPRGTGCTLTTSLTTGIGVVPQVGGQFDAGVYCARVADVGNLTNSATFTINIARPK